MLIKKAYKSTILITVLAMISGCGSGTPVNTDTNKEVTFNIEVDKGSLSSGRNLEVRIYDSEQIRQSDLQAGCSVSSDNNISCPAGITYKEVKPEVFSYNLNDIGNNVIVRSNNVTFGEKFRLQLSGLSTDNCNTASASVEKTADTLVMNIKDLQWMSTALGCL